MQENRNLCTNYLKKFVISLDETSQLLRLVGQKEVSGQYNEYRLTETLLLLFEFLFYVSGSDTNY